MQAIYWRGCDSKTMLQKGKNMNTKKLMLIDGNSVLNRAFFALPPMNDKNGHNVNAVYGFVNIFLKLVDTYYPD